MQPKAYPSAAWIPILVTTAEPQKQPNQVQNWINVLDHLFHLIDKFTAIKALLVLNKKILDIQFLELASRHGAQGKNVNQQNVNQRRSPDDVEREAREMVLSQILFSHSLERSMSHLKWFEVHLLFPLFFSECHRDDANLPDCGNVFFTIAAPVSLLEPLKSA
ncbi:hypothetical protein YC2023_008153 [Brassica napus]